MHQPLCVLLQSIAAVSHFYLPYLVAASFFSTSNAHHTRKEILGTIVPTCPKQRHGYEELGTKELGHEEVVHVG